MLAKCLLSILLILPQLLTSYELGIITLFRNEANYLKEWVEYHRMVGVDHFILYNDRSDDDWEAVLKPYIQSGLVEVIPWHKDEFTSLFPVWQVMAYKDGLRRFDGSAKWIAFIDIDEFILPKKTSTVVECLNQYYSSASGVYACWRNFGTGGVYINPKDPLLTNLTRCSEAMHPRNASGKSIVRPNEVFIERVWSPHHLVLKKGGQYYNGSGEPLYFKGDDLQVTPYHTSDYIQINHYAMRDENFYQNVRLPKAISKEYGELHLLEQHYEQFNRTSDYSMVQFLKSKHQNMYQKFWNK